MTDRRLPPNPFATRSTRPGAVPWQPLPDAPDELLERLAQGGGRGAICGPHGSGKSTLLQHLLAAAAERGWKTRLVAIRSQADLGRAVAAIVLAAGRGCWLGIDSWEKLGRFGGPLAWLARRRGGQIVVTTHQPTGYWPVLVNIRPDEETFRRLVAQLLRQADGSHSRAAVFEPPQLDAIFRRHRGNIREAFFELYDHFEQVSRPSAGET